MKDIDTISKELLGKCVSCAKDIIHVFEEPYHNIVFGRYKLDRKCEHIIGFYKRPLDNLTVVESGIYYAYLEDPSIPLNKMLPINTDYSEEDLVIFKRHITFPRPPVFQIIINRGIVTSVSLFDDGTLNKVLVDWEKFRNELRIWWQ